MKRELLIDFLNYISNTYKAGGTFTGCIHSYSDLLDSPLKEEVEVLIGELNRGIPREEAICNFTNKVSNPFIHRAMKGVLYAHRIGSNVSACLDPIISDLMLLPLNTEIKQKTLPLLSPFVELPIVEDNNKESKLDDYAIDRESISAKISDITSSGKEVESEYLFKKKSHLKAWNEFKAQVISQLMNIKEFKNIPRDSDQKEKEKAFILSLVVNQFKKTTEIENTPDKRTLIMKEVFDEAFGLGPLDDLLLDEAISLITVSNYDDIYFEKNGKIFQSNSSFSSDQALISIIERIVSQQGRRVDAQNPFVECNLEDGSLFAATIPPLSHPGASLTIRKSPQKKVQLEEMISLGYLDFDMAEFIKHCVLSKYNILISGDNETDRSILLSAIADCIPCTDKISGIESRFIRLRANNIVQLQTRPANLSGEGEVFLNDLFKYAKNIQSDRLIIGKVTDDSIYELLQSILCVFPGSMSTIHADSPSNVISQLEAMLTFSKSSLTSKSIRELISRSVNIIIHISRFSDGTKKIRHITEVTEGSQREISLSDIFTYKMTGMNKDRIIQGQFKSTGLKLSKK